MNKEYNFFLYYWILSYTLNSGFSFLWDFIRAFYCHLSLFKDKILII